MCIICTPLENIHWLLSQPPINSAGGNSCFDGSGLHGRKKAFLRNGVMMRLMDFSQRASAKGRRRIKKKMRRTYLPTFFEIFLRFFGLILEHTFVVFLGSPCRETAKNAIKKN
jgi:hypothetical protein